MKPKKWQKTEIIWNNKTLGLGWKTDIPVDEFKGEFHELINTKAVSVPSGSSDVESRTAIITFDVIRGVVGPTTRREEILTKIRTVLGSNWASCSTFGSGFKVCLELKQSFCDDVINFMKKLFDKLGIVDSALYHLQNFDVTTQTYFRQGAGYIPFAQQLKLDHHIHMGDELDVEMMPDTTPLT